MGKDDKIAKEALAPHVHTKIYSHAVKSSNKYGHKNSDTTPHYIVWPIGETVSELNSVIIPINGRCE